MERVNQLTKEFTIQRAQNINLSYSFTFSQLIEKVTRKSHPSNC